jgi:hypothetical protein
MFDDYKEKVIFAYQKKRDANAISSNLSRPTPAKLKAECLNIYRERYLKKDENTFRLFFGPKDNAADYSQNIKKLEIDKFRPLINFLNGRTNDTEEKNTELLAWLIDFEPRPYNSWNNYKEDIKTELTPGKFDDFKKTEDEDGRISPSESSNAAESNPDKEEKEWPNDEIGAEKIDGANTITQELQPAIEKIDGPKKIVSKSKLKKAIGSFIIIVAASGGSYLLSGIKDQKCMYWTGDHYEAISCNQKIGDTSIIALDTIKVAHLKKITHPDTLTQNSLGKVWYSKINGGIEFFTANGFHPIYNDRRLRPITAYILNKYVHRK